MHTDFADPDQPGLWADPTLDPITAPAGLSEQETQQQFIAAAAALEAKLRPAQTDVWENSPFRWINDLPPAGRGKAGEMLVEQWLRNAGVDVTKRTSAGHDRITAGLRAEIKFSMLWGNEQFRFQQVRPTGDWQALILLGVAPTRVSAWVVPKDIALQRITQNQHAGAAGHDTKWIGFQAGNAPRWLAPYGGTLTTAVAALLELAATAQ